MSECPHACCAIRANAFHRHVYPPSSCPPCGRLRAGSGAVSVGAVVAAVVARIAPQIPGLPTGSALVALVEREAHVVCDEGRDDPVLRDLDDRQRRTVLAVRVGIALAFPRPAGRSRPTRPSRQS